MKPIMIAFVWTMLTAVFAGLVLGWALSTIGYDWIYGPAIALSISVVDAWLKSRGLLARRLGHRDQAKIITSERAIPVSLEQILPGRQRSVDVVDQVRIVLPSGDVVAESDIKTFIGVAWSRQTRGKVGLSRGYWLRVARPAWSRERYEGIISALDQAGYIEGRRSGRPGRIVGSYYQIIKELKGE